MIEKNKIVAILSILVTAGVLFVGLWPFDLAPKNRAYWLPDQEGLHFDGSRGRFKLSVGGMAYTPSLLSALKPTPSEKGSFTIEIVLRPAVEVNSGVPHILGFVEGSGKEAFYLGQWKQSLIVRWYGNDRSDEPWMKEIGVRDALIKEKKRRLTLVSNRSTCSIYVDGELAKSFQNTSLIGQAESIRGYSVIMGNSRSAKGPWTGTVHGLKVYERALGEQEIARNRGEVTKNDSSEGLIAAYSLEKIHGVSIPDLSGNKNTLSVPERVTLTNRMLAWPDRGIRKNSSPAEDIVVNILGFVPFGFLFAFWLEKAIGWRRWRSYLLTVLIGALVSLSIEVAQAFIPARDSSMVDLLCNSGGTVVGAGLQMAGKLGGWKADS